MLCRLCWNFHTG